VVVNDKPLNIVLQPNSEIMEDVTIKIRDKGTHLSRVSPVQTTKISGAELCKAACCNLAESFTTNPSVDVTYSDAVTGAKQIKLLGLSGLYVQTMTENMPAFRGLASIYGLEYIPGAWMESIQVSKGTASVINGYEAIAGQINVEYKKPERSEKLFVNGFINSELRAEFNINSSIRFSEKLSTMLLGHYKNGTRTIDNNGDGFLDMPMIEQYNFINRWNYTNNKYIAQYGVKLINESRESGQMDYYKGESDAYQVDIATERYEFFTKQAWVFNKESGHSVAFQGSGSYHNQNSIYGNRVYEGTQNNAYLNLVYQNYVNGNDAHEVSFGASFMYDDYEETLDSVDFYRTEKVPGLFGQYTYKGNGKLVVLTGLRVDYHNEYGLFFTPRVHTKYNISRQFHMRASIGMGYRSANVLAENSYLLASSRLVEIAGNLDQEKALNTGLNATLYLPVLGRELTLSADYYYTRFIQQVIPDTDSDPNKVSFYNLDGISYSQSIQAQGNYEVVKGLSLSAAYRVTDVKVTINEKLREKPLISKYKGLLTVSYQTPLKKWQVDFTSQFNGGGRMPAPNYDYWDERFNPYTILNAQVTKYFKTWSIYIGGENLTNFKMDTPIIDASNPWSENFDASMTWGPVHGIVIYGGFRFSLDHKK
ncbi:MAG: TonB-dependent receptor, partial [Bacteroidales bacterium]|nr:TonB-dependent receptor [Bacteroidales bacterium]